MVASEWDGKLYFYPLKNQKKNTKTRKKYIIFQTKENKREDLKMTLT